MKTPKEFDYDLWTTADGRYFSRLKRTGEVTEITHEVMKFLRNEEKKLRREKRGMPTYGVKDGKSVVVSYTTILSTSYITDNEDMEGAWCCDNVVFEDKVITAISEQVFRKALTEKQLNVYVNCMIKSKSFKGYAEEQCVDKTSIRDIVKAIRKKAKNFF